MVFFSCSAAFINHLQKEQHSSGLFPFAAKLRGVGCNLQKREGKQSCCWFISQSVKWAGARTTAQSYVSNQQQTSAASLYQKGSKGSKDKSFLPEKSVPSYSKSFITTRFK